MTGHQKLAGHDRTTLAVASSPVKSGEKGAKVSKCRKKYKSYSNTVKSDSKSLAKSHDVTPRSVSSFSRLVKVLVDACAVINLYKSESPFVLLTTMPPKAIPPKENTYLCSCPKCMVGMDTPKKVSWATYKRHRKDRLKVSSYAEFLGHTMVDHGSEGLSVSKGK